MNLSEDFISIQGILLSVEKSSGILRNIKYRGGHEKSILDLITELHKYLSSRNYIKNNEINNAFDDQLQKICMFLILNTEVKSALNEPEFEHLLNIAPQLSTCLLANIVIALDLSKHYCKALHRFDLNVIEEFLSEIIPCIKMSKPKTHIQNAFEFLNLIISKISATSSEEFDKLSDIASHMLVDLTRIHGEQIETVKIDSVYEYMGHTLLNLLDLLLVINEKNQNLIRITDALIQTCSSIMMAVTLHVFCFWAEIQVKGEVLQILIAEKSYLFIEKYQKYLAAKELVTMMGSIAQKPKDLREQIHAASVETMITMINKAGRNQKEWFAALLNTQVLQNTESIKCLEKWAHLSAVGDVQRLLNLGVRTKNNVATDAVIKCAATLEFENLVLVATRHFHDHGIKNLKEDLQQELILLFNKIKNKNIEDEFCKELFLLVLQNFEHTLAYTFGECSKNAFYSCNLGQFWPSIKEIITIDDVGMKTLKNVMLSNPPSEQTSKNYIPLFNILINKQIFSHENIVLNIIFPLLQDSRDNKNYALLKSELEILKDLHGSIHLSSSTEHVINFLFDVMKVCRCNFLNIDFLKQEIVRLTVEIIQNTGSNTNYEGQATTSDDMFVSFYKQKLYTNNVDASFISHFFPIAFDHHAETVAHLIKILPLCTTPEWIMISTDLYNICGIEKSVELLCDSLILLCELVKSQETKTQEVQSMFFALRHCLQNVAVVIKECIQPKVSNPQEDITLTKHICHLLKELPTGPLKTEEGLVLASLFSDTTLRSLRPDKKFACLVASIHESHICKMLAEKILS